MYMLLPIEILPRQTSEPKNVRKVVFLKCALIKIPMGESGSVFTFLFQRTTEMVYKILVGEDRICDLFKKNGTFK